MLITPEQIAQFKQLTASLSSPKVLEPYIQEAQEFDLRPFLGDELYADLLDKYDQAQMTDAYKELYNGCTYTYGGITYKHEGVVPILAYFTYARYAKRSNITSTKYGLVQKTNDFSQPISSADRAQQVNDARSGAIVYQERVRHFLNANEATYPLWRGGHKRRKSAIKITAVGGNSTDGRFGYCNDCKRKTEYCSCHGL